MPSRAIFVPVFAAFFAALPLAPISHAQAPAAAPAPASGGAWSSSAYYTPDRRDQRKALEQALLASPDPAVLRASHDILASEPHLTGTPGGIRGAERLAARFREFGLSVEVPEYRALLPIPVNAELEIVAPELLTLSVRERRLPSDPFTNRDNPDGPDISLGWNGYSGSGDVTGEVVYANYGTNDDFAKLKAMNISCEGKIVLARYGGNFRGFKAKFAQEAGAAGLLIFTDPGDGGYAAGLVYPEGSWGNDSYIQRGSINTLSYDGDPVTPGVAATEGAKRLHESEVPLPRIPVQPIAYAAAREILSRMTGPAVQTGPDGPTPPPGRAWQGGLPFTYRLTGGPELKVRLKVEQKRQTLPIRDVIATIPGALFPDQFVLVGAHHDAWVYGADDPLSGTIVIVEAARAFAAAAAKGFRPAPTIIFCGWDAEEMGIIGSSEWVEDNAAKLSKGAIAYFNLDAAVSGRDFSASSSPSLQKLIWEAARETAQPPDPRSGAGQPALTIFDAWLRRTQARAAAPPTTQRRADQASPPRDDGNPPIGDLGGGSDHSGFLTHLCIPSGSMGFGGAGGTAYHSMYDNLVWYRQMMHDDYAPHAALTRAICLVLARLADADAIPYDLAAPAAEAHRYLRTLEDTAKKNNVAFDTAPLLAGLDKVETAAASASRAIEHAMSSNEDGARLAARVNALQIACERAWFDDAGLPDRPWRRNVFIAPDETSGYASWPLPALRRAIERADTPALAAAATQFSAAIRRLEYAITALEEAVSPLAP